MNDEKTEIFFWGAVFSALVGIYGFFVKHLIKHPDKDEIEKLWNEKQNISECEQIVRRIDENHKETCKKLDRILEKLE